MIGRFGRLTLSGLALALVAGCETPAWRVTSFSNDELEMWVDTFTPMQDAFAAADRECSGYASPISRRMDDGPDGGDIYRFRCFRPHSLEPPPPRNGPVPWVLTQ